MVGVGPRWTRREYVPVGSAPAIRPPWMAEVPVLQEQKPAWRATVQRGPTPATDLAPSSQRIQFLQGKVERWAQRHREPPAPWAARGRTTAPGRQGGGGVLDRRPPGKAGAEPTGTYLWRVQNPAPALTTGYQRAPQAAHGPPNIYMQSASFPVKCPPKLPSDRSVP